MRSDTHVVRVAAIGDLHYGRNASPGSLQPLFAQIMELPDRDPDLHAFSPQDHAFMHRCSPLARGSVCPAPA